MKRQQVNRQTGVMPVTSVKQFSGARIGQMTERLSKLGKRLIAALAAILFLALPAKALGLNADSTGSASATGYIHEEQFDTEHDLTGLFSSFTEVFYVGEWDVDVATFRLCFSSTPLARTEISDFTVSLNGERFYSARLPDSKGEVYQIDIPMPVSAIQEGANVLTLESYIRTNDSDNCRDDISKASWMTIYDDSSVSISYTPTATVSSVADLYKQLRSIEALENSQSAFYINKNATDAELTAAGYALAGTAMGTILYSENMELFSVSSASELTSKKYGVYISEYASLFEDVRTRLSDEQKAAAEKGAVAALIFPAEGVSLLVITGADPVALKNAGNLFGNSEYMRQSVYTWRKIAGAEDVTFDWEEGDAMRALTTSGSYLKGPFRQSTEYYVLTSANHVLRAGSEIYLAFRYSENLDFNRSMVTVYVNDIPIGSKKLTADAAKNDMMRFSIPEDIGVTGSFGVRVSFDLEIQDMWCTMRQEDMPWAYVSPDSAVTILSEESNYLLFDYYPAPFIQDGAFNDLVFVLPNNPSAADIEAMRGLLLTLGTFLNDNSGSLRVCTNAGTGDISKSNVISVGTFSRNPLARQLNAQLYFRFSPEGTTILSNEKMLIDANYGALLGSGQVFYSPYSPEKKAMLLIAGVTEENMLKAAEYLSYVDNIWKVSGDAFVADGEDIFFFRFKEDNAKSRTWLELLTARSDLLYTAAAGALVFVGLIIVATTLIRRKRRTGNE